MANKGTGSRAKIKSKTHKLTIKGSCRIVAEFFEYSINSILYQRGVYPAEDFVAVKKYGLNMFVAQDDQVKAYIRKIMTQLHKWMLEDKISKLAIVITDKETNEHVEKWEFDVDILTDGPTPVTKEVVKEASHDQENSQSTSITKEGQSGVDEAKIQAEISHLFRQITSTVTFLPVLTNACTFNVLVYADANSEVPVEWGDSDAKDIKNAEKVQLRSFATSSHRVGAVVSYQ